MSWWWWGTCYQSNVQRHPCAYTHWHLHRVGDGGVTFELGGGLLRNVFPIFCFPSASADRTSVWAAARWSQRQQTQHFAKLSSFYLPSSFFSLSPSMHFYCSLSPLTQEHFFLFFIPSPFFSFISSLSLVPPLLLARLSHFSLPHFLCALQWFFRFFPIYDLPLSPRLCPSKPSNSFTTPLPAVAAHGS